MDVCIIYAVTIADDSCSVYGLIHPVTFLSLYLDESLGFSPRKHHDWCDKNNPGDSGVDYLYFAIGNSTRTQGKMNNTPGITKQKIHTKEYKVGGKNAGGSEYC